MSEPETKEVAVAFIPVITAAGNFVHCIGCRRESYSPKGGYQYGGESVVLDLSNGTKLTIASYSWNGWSPKPPPPKPSIKEQRDAIVQKLAAYKQGDAPVILS